MSHHHGGAGGGGNNNNTNPEKRRYFIKPFRPHCQMDEVQAREIWESLRCAIVEIYKQNASMLSFEELYRNAYNLVLHKHGDLLYEGVRSTIAERLETVAAEVCAASDSSLLALICAKWEEHQTTMEMVRDILMYMDRTYATQTKKLLVYDLGLVEFRRAVARHETIGPRLRTLLLENVDLERRQNQFPVDRASMRKALHMLAALGAVDGAAVYAHDFEAPFLTRTRDFYRAESAAILSDRATECPEYVDKVESRLREEEDRVTSYLHASTRSKLLTIARKELVEAHALTLVDSRDRQGTFHKLLKDDRLDDLKRMRTLFAATSHHLDLALCDALRAHVKKQGDDLVDQYLSPSVSSILTSSSSSSASARRDDDDDKAAGKETPSPPHRSSSSSGTASFEPVVFLKALLAMRAQYDRVVEVAFGGDTIAQKRLKEAFEALVNADPQRTATCLVVYVDELMRSGFKGLNEREVDAHLDDAVVLFRYLHDKDIFENFYKNHLAKRLLGRKSASHEAEKTMLSKLKAECGYQFTTKLEGMFSDMRASRDAMDKFRTSPEGAAAAAAPPPPPAQRQQQLIAGTTPVTSSSSSSSSVGERSTGPTALAAGQQQQQQQQQPPEIEVTMLTQGFWPVASQPRCALPDSVDSLCRAPFEAYYLRVNSGRKLAWQTACGTAEVRAHFGPPRAKHELVVTTFQMCVLALFDGRDPDATPPLSWPEIRRKVDAANPTDLKRHLVSLCTPKHRVLLKQSKGKGVADDDAFRVNRRFASKLKRVKIPLVALRDGAANNNGASHRGGGGSDGDGRGGASRVVDFLSDGGLGDPVLGGAGLAGPLGPSGLPRAVEEDRRHLVEANVVRIMKTRKTLRHNELVAEVTRQLAHRFYPQPQFIKKCIESLLDREYIERDVADARAYKYLA